MTKKRTMAMVVSSPLILVVLFCIALTAVVGYAVNGKWELKELVAQWRA